MKEATSDGEGERMNLLRPGMADGHVFHAVGQQVKRWDEKWSFDFNPPAALLSKCEYVVLKKK